MTTQTVGYKAKAFEPLKLAFFFLIAFKVVMVLVVALVLVWHRNDAHKCVRGRPWILLVAWDYGFASASLVLLHCQVSMITN